ncbi:MAG: hypothetical protein KDM91_12895 [Verrucomicrobiae bacterium]|nr:hypothetical protein [Verrucomicrobiae bacterium]MCP5541139.1 hypothetical protein [Akkermansiaceae bacterium]MCP5551260.1 hypothetical protein [Akkermansiaceae bacterium]
MKTLGNRDWGSGTADRRGVSSALLAAIGLAAGAGVAPANAEPLKVADVKRDTPVDFATEIYPFLKKNCLACHNSTKSKAGLVLESPKDMIEGGDTGPSLEPGKGENSLLFTTSAHLEEPTMPPANNKSNAKDLTPEQLALLKLWIDQGAKGDAVAGPAPTSWTLLTGSQPILSAALSPDGRFAAAGRGQQIHLYDLALGRLAATLRDPSLKLPTAHLDYVQQIAFHPGGQEIASGGYRTAKVWRRSAPAAGAVVALPAEPSALAVSPDRKRVAIGGADGSVSVLPLDTPGAAPVSAKDHAAAVTGLAFSADGKTLFTVSADKTVRRRDLAAIDKSRKLDLPAPASAVAVIDQGKRLAIAGADHVIRLCASDLSVPPAPKPATPPPPAAPAPAPKPDAAAAKPDATPPPAPPKPDAAPAPAPPSPFTDLKPHTKPVTALLALKADGTEFLSAAEDGLVIHWKLNPDGAAAEVRRLTHGVPVARLALSPDGARLASAGNDGPVKLWNTADGAAVAELKGDPDAAPRVAALQREQAVAARLKAHWDTKAPEAEKVAKDEAAKAVEAGEQIAKKRRELEARRAALAMLEAKLPKATDEELAKAAEELATAERDLAGAERNRDLSVKLAGNALADQTAALAMAKEAEATDAALKAEIEALQKAATEAEGKTRTAGLAFSPDGAQLAQALPDGTVRLWAAATGAALEHFPTAAELRFLAWGATDRELLAARQDKNLVAWSAPGAAWTLAKTLGDGKDAAVFSDRVTALAYDPTGARLVTGTGVPSRSGEIRLWDTATWTPLAENLEAHEDTLTAFAFSPDGRQLVSGATDRMVKVFDAATLENARTFEGHTSHVLDVDWNADGLTLASAGADLQVKIWDIAEGQQKSKVEGYEKQVTAVAFVAGTDTLVTASGDKAVKLANAPLPDAGDTFLQTAAISADGRLIAAGGDDGILRVWDATAKKLVISFDSPEAKAGKVAGK